MAVEVVTPPPVRLGDLFELREQEDRRLRLAAFDGEVVEIPAQVRIVERRIEVELLGGAFALEVRSLANIGVGATGFGTLSVPDRESGRRVLDGVAQLIGADIAAPGATPGPLVTLDVSVMAVPLDGGVALQIKTEPMRFGVWFARDEREGRLALAVDELEPGFLTFAELWAGAFCDGVQARRTRAEDPLLSSDTPWIAAVAPMQADGVVWWDAAFGGETLFAPADDGAVLAWDDLAAAPRRLFAVEGRLSLYPSPDGRWLAVEASRPGAAELHLVTVADGEARSLCTSPGAIRFGGTSQVIAWSRDGRRFSFTCNRGEDTISLVYDVEARAFVDASEIDAIPGAWCGADVQLRRTDYEHHGDGRTTMTFHDFLWTPGTDALRSSEPPPRRSLDELHELFHEDDGLEIGRAGGDKRVVAIAGHDTFTKSWGNTMLVDASTDARAFDLATGTWRYLAARGLRPLVLAPAGRGAVFLDGEQVVAGTAAELPAFTAPPIEWGEPDVRGIAIASALAGDMDESNIAVQRMTDEVRAEIQPLLDEIVATSRP